MGYRHLSQDERYKISGMRVAGHSHRSIARTLGRSPSTIGREVERNRYPTDGFYRAEHADSMARGRRRRSRQMSHFSPPQWSRVKDLLREDWSPEQVSGFLVKNREFRISHETIYRHVWWDKFYGGNLYKHLRGSRKQRRKRYGAYDSRGRLAGKRMIEQRPAAAENRSRFGHWEIDTVMGAGRECILTMVDRKSGYLKIGLLKDRTVKETNSRFEKLVAKDCSPFKTITADNGCEFHGYKQIEKKTGVTFYFANPHHSWERGTNENTNGLIRQYLPKGLSMAGLTQACCNAIAHKLNNRPRKRHKYETPAEVLFKWT